MRSTPTRLALALLLLAPSAPAQEAPLGADALVDQAWLRLPTYDGGVPSLLDATTARDARAAAALLDAALALEPEHARALWSAGHAHSLLGRDLLTRADEAGARAHYARGLEVLGRARALDGSDPWAPFSRGLLHGAFGAHEAAAEDLELALVNVQRRVDAGDGNAGWLRFKVLEWLPEARMRVGDDEGAQVALRAFHEEFSSNRWPLLIALAECHARARELDAAREVYLRILEEFPSDFQAYALLGYLEGLLGNRAAGAARLDEALERELEPGMYTRLWLWILADGEARGRAEADLRGFLENPPDAVTAWDRTLGRFVIGEGDRAGFLAAAHAEHERRLETATPLDDLLCEAWFYAGLRAEGDGDPEAALEAYAEALAFRPLTWKWEWAYARLHYAHVAAGLERAAAPAFAVADGTLRSEGRAGRLLEARWHAPETERAVPALGRAPRPGDLLRARVRWEAGPVESVLLVTPARSGDT